jgi:hypothetical protein
MEKGKRSKRSSELSSRLRGGRPSPDNPFFQAYSPRSKGSYPNGTNFRPSLSGNALASGLKTLIVADIPAASADPLTKAVPFGSYTFSDKA